MPDQEPQIDFTRIDFPSDSLTIQAVRRRFPEALDGKAAGTHLDLEKIDLPGMLRIERTLAKEAFEVALGKKPRFPGALGDVARYSASEVYVRYGLASGDHHAQQLIRAIEQAAARQAREHMRGPPAR
jgi:hypothetical protein